jgi:ABC-type transporter Mla subunit MlaD
MQRQRSGGLRKTLYWPIDHPWYVVLAVGVVLLTVHFVGTRSEPHHVRVAFPTAFNLVSGLSVDVDGLEVGKISGVHYVKDINGGSTIVDVGINDPQFWPLHAGTTVESRWGTTIGNGTRRLDLIPGPASAPVLPEGGIINAKDTLPAVDLDQVFKVLNPPTRANLRQWLIQMGNGLGGQAGGLHGGLNSAPPAVAAANGVLTDLALDTAALQGLITNGNRLTATLAARAPAISDLITVAARTFSTLSAHASNLQSTIQNAPAALVQARSTLARLDTSVGVLSALITDIAPGAAKLSPLAIAMRPALSQLRTIVPTAVATLNTATAAAPRITHLLNVATPFMPALKSDSSQLAPMVACLRPYAPELGSAITDANGWLQPYRLENPHGTPGVTYFGAQQGQYVRQHSARAIPEASVTTLHAYPPTISTQAFVAATGKQYALPRPPGYGVGQPWFIPECGITQNALNPANDPEQQK